MRQTTKRFNGLVLGCLAALAMSSAIASDKPGKDQSKRLQQQLRMAEQEKTQLAQKVAAAEGQVKDVEAKAADAQRRSDAATARLARLTRELEEVKTQVATGKAAQAALVAKLADTERSMRDLKLVSSADKQQLETALMRQRTAFAGCAERNARMYKLGNELLDRYEEKSCFSSVLQAEPFTGLKRAQIEKMVEDDRERLDKDQLASESIKQPGRSVQ